MNQIMEHKKIMRIGIIGGGQLAKMLAEAAFRFGYEIHKQTNMPWIADYRDDWTTSEVNDVSGFLNRFLLGLSKRSEKKWVGTSSCITTVSPYYAQKIGEFVRKPGHVLLNGFFEDDLKTFQNRVLYDDFTIVYNGMLYGSQQIEIFFINNPWSEHSGGFLIFILYLGIDYKLFECIDI